MGERSLSRIGAATGVLSVVVTFVGFGVHGGLPNDVSANSVAAYVNGVSETQAGLGNYLELLGYLLFLGFAAYLYVMGRAAGPVSMHWVSVLAIGAAITYTAMSAFAIAGQVMMVDWIKLGGDPKTVLGAYLLDSAGFTLSFEAGAMFLLALGAVLWAGGLALRLIGTSGAVVGLVLLATGLISTISVQNSSSQTGYLAVSLWTLLAGIYLLIRPARLVRATD